MRYTKILVDTASNVSVKEWSPIERAAGRLQMLKGGESYHSKVSIRALVSEEEVENSAKEINHLQQNPPKVEMEPLEKE